MKKILFVTSDPKYVAEWKRTLEGNGYEFDVALSASEAVGRAESGHPDMVIIGVIETPDDVLIKSIKCSSAANTGIIKIQPDQAAKPEAVLARIAVLLAPKKILIAEDDRQMSGIMGMILSSAGFTVRATYDGLETLKEIKAWRPHLIILDIMLPVVDGFHICQTMNEDHTFDPKPSVLIVSGRGSDWDQNLGAACGAEDYIVKPFKNEFFLQRVREILEKDRAGR